VKSSSKKEEHAVTEVYADTFEEAMSAWEEIRGEGSSWGNYLEIQIRGLKWFVESSLRDAIKWKLGVGWYQRSDGRQGYRNGFYRRMLVTPYGSVEIEVPRLREGSYEHDLFDKNGLLTKDARDLILETYLAGASTRRVGEVLRKVLGYEVSHTTVSAICKGLNKLVREYWQRRLDDEWEYLIVDAIVVKNRAVVSAEKRFVLVALGISKAGKKEVLSFKQAESEAEVCWQGFLDDLERRGLKGENLKMITMDGSRGLIAAAATVWPHIPLQRCWVHKLRNVAAKLRRRNQSVCLSGASSIYESESLSEARRRFLAWRERWIDEEPKAVKCLEENIDEMLEFLAVPKADWKTVRTTNPIERVFREVRRRIRTISCFSNRQSVDRMLYAILTYQNRQWDAKCRKAQFTHNA
jgi:transposase-like protein